MPDIISAADIPALFINDTPLLDVRAPMEFARGAFPRATNLPLLDDQEREAVGKRYKAAGQQAAIALGQELVSGKKRAQRIAAWRAYLTQHPNAVMYCFRGGLRSTTVQQWLAECGVQIARVAGGYKRMRQELLQTIEWTAANTELLIVAGKTGSGKTHLINALQNSVDLEGLASHRGSAFGNRVQQQPTQIDFENALAIALLRLPGLRAPASTTRRLFLEDESRAIGSLSIPQSLYEKMLASPIALLEESLDQRVDTILNDYIVSNYHEFRQADPAGYEAQFAGYLLRSLEKIQRRLGGDNYRELRASMEQALAVSATDMQAHREWIKLLLQKYYDPMYEYQLGKKSRRIVFRGNREELVRWAAHLDLPARAQGSRQ